MFTRFLGLFTSYSKVSKQDELKDEKRNIQNNIQVAQKKLKVRLLFYSIIFFAVAKAYI